jgi:hypothetical protein
MRYTRESVIAALIGSALVSLLIMMAIALVD